MNTIQRLCVKSTRRFIQIIIDMRVEMMRKVAIVSCYFQKNYGSMLQAFATQKVLDYLGYENETICIDGIAKEIRDAKLKHYFFQLSDFNMVKGKLGFVKRFLFRKINRDLKANISIREEIVREAAHREVPVVCDPTLLFTAEQWAEDFPVKRIVKEKYMFCYFLGNNPDQRDFVRKVKELTGLKIVALLHMDEYVKSDCEFPDYDLFDIARKSLLI